MLCRKCGAENDDRAYLCTQCGAALKEDSPSDRPPREGNIPAAASGGAISPHALPGGIEKENPSERPAYPDEFPTHLVPAILVTIFCCQPFGVVALVFAAMASSYLASGNRAAAIRASDTARTWCWVAFWCGLVTTILYVLFFMVTLGAHRF
jgi:hypothetical protein